MATITIEIPDGKRAEWVNGVLTLIDYKPKDITERIQTFEDACEWCKKNGGYDLVEQYQDALNVGLQRAKDILAYLKLRIITCALNEGWEPTFEEGENRWVPYMYNGKIQVSNRRSCRVIDCAFSKYLMFKSEKLAEYAAQQFRDIYMDFCKGKE